MDEQEIHSGEEPQLSVGPAHPMVHAEPRLRDVPKPFRGVRSGPLAAVVATVGIIAATALPSPAKFSPASAVAPVMATLALTPMPALGPIGTVSLEGSLADMVLDMATPESAWIDRGDGSAAFSVKLVARGNEQTYLEGVFDLRGRTSSKELAGVERQLFAASAPDVPGMAPWLGSVEPSDGADVYSSLAGSLIGHGALEGAVVSVRNVPGTAIRRGLWEGSVDGEAVVHEDTVFARLVWMREANAAERSIDVGGEGSLGVYLSADSSLASSLGLSAE